jgi:arylsulfatase A-like enzyme
MLGSLLAAMASTVAFAAAPPARPNIIVILSDDMGYSDVGCYGGEIETPRLDRLAEGGLRFTQFYNTARCCPTRASLLTGLYPHDAGVGHMSENHGSGFPGYTGSLNDRSRTMAEVLRPAGYRSYLAGKWHVAAPLSPLGPKDHWPLQRGFDEFYGTLEGAGSYFDPAGLCRGNTWITPENDPEYRPDTYYYTDAITDHALGFIRQHATAAPEQPFFLYLAYTAPHWPLHALPEDIARYEGRYEQGYDATRRARIQKMERLGLLDGSWKPAPTIGRWDDPNVGRWEEIRDRRWEERCMEVYAAQVDRMDQGIGRVVDELERLGRMENTVILYLHDNGACAETMWRRPYRLPAEPRPFGPDDLQRKISPPLMQTRSGVPVRSGQAVMPGPADSYVTYGESWANVSNTPFRDYKHWVHEGGIATPLIVHWPAGIDATRHGQLVHEPAHVIDIMATVVDLADAHYPAAASADDGREPAAPLAGVSLLPAWQGRPLERAEPLFWEHEGCRAVRDGRWKLVARGPADPWELFDLETDRTEQHDLAILQPERVRTMATQWENWARSHRVVPWIWDPPFGATLGSTMR